MKHLTSISVLTSILAVAAAAYAGDRTQSGQVGDIRLLAGSGYDEFILVGDVAVCDTSVDASWRHRVRIERSIGNYDAVIKALLSAKLSGAQVTVTGTNNADARCILKTLVIDE